MLPLSQCLKLTTVLTLWYVKCAVKQIIFQLCTFSFLLPSSAAGSAPPGPSSSSLSTSSVAASLMAVKGTTTMSSCCSKLRVSPSVSSHNQYEHTFPQPYIPETLTVQCLSFCLLSVLTNYLYIASLRVLDCTVVTALFATNASFVYLLSWVILHQQFVGIRVTWRLTYDTRYFVGYS